MNYLDYGAYLHDSCKHAKKGIYGLTECFISTSERWKSPIIRKYQHNVIEMGYWLYLQKRQCNGGYFNCNVEIRFTGDEMTIFNFTNPMSFGSYYLWNRYVKVESIAAGTKNSIRASSYGGGVVHFDNAVE
jgi:hypothetical protein